MIKKPVKEFSKPESDCGSITKNVGIGVVGLPTRPATGIFDFTSQGFEELRRFI